MKGGHILHLVLVALLPWAITARAGASEIDFVEVNNGGLSDPTANLAGTRTYDIRLHTIAIESIRDQQIRAQLSQGTFFQHPLGATGPSDPALFSQSPTLPFDTFIASGVADNSTNPVILGGSTIFRNPNPSPSPIFTPTMLDIKYTPQLGQATTSQPSYLSARITLSPDAQGFFSYAAAFNFDTLGFFITPANTYLIVNGQIIPEPASGILLATALLGLMFRHPRRPFSPRKEH